MYGYMFICVRTCGGHMSTVDIILQKYDPRDLHIATVNHWSCNLIPPRLDFKMWVLRP